MISLPQSFMHSVEENLENCGRGEWTVYNGDESVVDYVYILMDVHMIIVNVYHHSIIHLIKHYIMTKNFVFVILIIEPSMTSQGHTL